MPIAISVDTTDKPSRLKEPVIALVFLTVSYFALAIFLARVLQFKFLQSDALGYWQDSLAWRTPFHPFHVPGYPLLIAMLRGITFGVLPGVGLMMIINLASFLVSALLVYQILKRSSVDKKLAVLGMLLFGLWPFVGLVYAVYPMADLPSLFFFLAGLYLLLTSRRLPAALLLGLAMVTHKAMWIFVVLLLAAEVLRSKKYLSRQNFLIVIVTFVPLGALWLLGAAYHGSPAWLFSSNLQAEVASRGSLPLLDGLWGTIQEGGFKGTVKGLLLAAFACLSAVTLYACLKLKYQNYLYGAAISLAVLILFLVLNRYEIWAAMRYSRLLVIPLMLIANTYARARRFDWRSPAILACLSILFASQFAYAWYLAVVFFG
jgi:hypothetical protein